ncbi:MAG: TAXI family TRAP transporter solute-binding subunit [bacterium]|nr:TAXI family TRAP transporter solute-binding subunit [bacterium]
MMFGIRRMTVSLAAILVAFAMIVSGAEAARVKTSVASAGPGAAAFVIWGGLAALISQESKTVEMNNVTTQGAVADIRLVEAKKADFGLGVATLLQLAFKGKKMFKKKYTNIRGMGPGTVSFFHIATSKRAGYKSVAELDGKRVSFAQKGSSTHFMTRTMVALAKIKVREENLNWNVAADAIKDNRLDAFTIPNPIPSPSILKLATSLPITLLPLDGAVRDEMLKQNSAYFPVTIPANSYDGQDKDVPTLGYTAWTIVGAQVPNDVVYEVTRLNFSEKGKKFLLRVHKGWQSGFSVAPALDQMAAIKMKIHPGAARYWKEKGHKIPASIE